mmetsp:Transcript_28111/g.38654  ORF Transcript_28111/g.38654 Transcript_28111/m.38654 type:complete len:199 (+) Transcript_28111:9-605(+)
MLDEFGIGKAAVVNVDSKAYMQIYLHAAKYPSTNIVGFLLGQQKPNGEIIVEDILAICHSYPTASLLEIGALTAEKIGNSSSRKVLGVYYANEVLSDYQVPNYVVQIASTVRAYVDFCIVCQIRNDLLSKKDNLFIQIMNSNNMKNKCKIVGGKSLEEINDVLDSLVYKGIQFKFADFEDHMNDNGVSDFRNPTIELD